MGNKRIPEVRFAGFSGEWEQSRLNEVADIIGGGTPSTSVAEYWNGDIDWYSPVEIGKEIYASGSQRKITSLGLKKSSAKILPANKTILFTSRAGIGDMAILKKEGATNQGFQSMVVNDNQNVYFIYSMGHKIKKFALRNATGSTFLEISGRELGKMNLFVPSSKEQHKIGGFFEQLDKTIELHKQELTTLKQTKQGFLQKMFPKEGESVPEVRFPGFSGDWESSVLNDVLSHIKSGLSRKLSNQDIGLPVIRANNINDGVLDLVNDIKYWYVNDPQGAKTQNYLVHENDILVNFINSETKMGTAAIVKTEPIRPTIYTTNILNLRVNSDVAPYFIYFLTETKRYKNYIESITKPAVNQSSFTTVDFRRFSFLAPVIEEQIKIGEFFKQLDNIIALHQRELDSLKETKKAFLQKMFV